MRARVYIYTGDGGHHGQPLSDTSAQLYLNCGTYRSGQPLDSGCSSVGISFIIRLLYIYSWILLTAFV